MGARLVGLTGGSSGDGNPRGLRLQLLGLQAATSKIAVGYRVMRRSRTPAVGPIEVWDEPGMAERFQSGLRRALTTPPRHQGQKRRVEGACA
jgi:hypothetical protein